VTLDADTIVERIRNATTEHTPPLAVRDVLEEVIAAGGLERILPEVTEGGIAPLYRADDLTILRVAWTPGIRMVPHDHKVWAVIAMYGGIEDNAFYRRHPEHGLTESGGKQVHAGDVLVLGDDTIHSVANTHQDFAVAIHVYGNDFFAPGRSEWDFETYTERPRDQDGIRRTFTEANQRWAAANT
jgi:predicted metal-dependent enzyme (double-stranded beta helix superfamily)